MPPQPKKTKYISPTNRSSSSIDLTLCDPSIFLDFSWNTFDDACGSDHYPIILNNEEIIHDHIPTC